MRGYPLSLEKGAELCTAINISILHKFENTKHNETEICPECGIAEAVEAYAKNANSYGQ